MNEMQRRAPLRAIFGKLGEIWRRSNPPEALGERFEKLIAVHDRGGFAAVERRLASISISGTMRANAYTALARHLMKSDRAGAAQAARHAYALDPKPYRLKWLAFRLYEAGEVIEAKALLDILPPETSFAESETRRADQLRAEALALRRGEARQKPDDAKSQLGILRRMDEMMKETLRAQMELFFRQWCDLGFPLSVSVGG